MNCERRSSCHANAEIVRVANLYGRARYSRERSWTIHTAALLTRVKRKVAGLARARHQYMSRFAERDRRQRNNAEKFGAAKVDAASTIRHQFDVPRHGTKTAKPPPEKFKVAPVENPKENFDVPNPF